MLNVSKEVFLNALICPTLGWLMRSEEICKSPTLAERFRMKQGKEIHRIARSVFPEGKLVEHINLEIATEQTRNLMNNPHISIIFEATFLTDRFVAKADILKRKSDGWHMIEVKSDAKEKKEHIDDMAYTTMVIERSDFNVSDISLMLISKDYRLGMKDKELFAEIDYTDEVKTRVNEFYSSCERIDEITRQEEKPESNLIFDCKKCELFKDCVGQNIENHIFEIPRLSKSKFEKLVAQGIVCIEDIPDEFPLTDNQVKVRDCVKEKKTFVGNNLKDELESIIWPAFYLDFETVMTAIPLFPDVAPYTQIPTQYSIHKCSKLGHIDNHYEYLAYPGKDWRAELAERLINDLKGKGSTIVYSNFEKKIINNLVKVFPDLADELNTLISRFVDLEAIMKKNFYEPKFHGSTSIKKTLPALVPDMSYEGLEISDGDTAMAVFAFMVKGKYEKEEVEKLRKKLLDYCKHDTLATVKLHEKLMGYV